MMERKIEKKKTSFAKNVLMFMAAQVLIKVLGLIYRMVILNIPGFGDIGNGYYSAGYQVYVVLIVISSQGIPGAVSKLVAARVAKGEYNNAHRIFKVALFVFGIIGFLASLSLFVFSNFIANNLLNVPDVSLVLKVLSPAIFFVCVSATMRGYFAGLGTMGASSISETLEQFFNCCLTVLFVYALIGQDPYIMAAGGNVSTTLAVLISFSYLLIYYKRNIKKYTLPSKDVVKKDKESTKKLSKLIIITAIPLTIGSLISVIMTLIDTITISNCMQIAYQHILFDKVALETLAMEAAGTLSKIDTIAHLPIAVNLAFYTVLIPEITAALEKKDNKTAARKISSSYAISILLSLPCAVGFMCLAKPIVTMLYPAAPDGYALLYIMSINMILICLSHTLQGALFGVGRMYTPAAIIGISTIINLVLDIILIRIPYINIYGAVIASFVAELFMFITEYIITKKEINFSININKKIIRPFIAAIVMGIIINIFRYSLINTLGNTTLTILSILLGVIVYVIMVLILNILDKDEVLSFPKGDKIYKILKKYNLCKE